MTCVHCGAQNARKKCVCQLRFCDDKCHMAAWKSGHKLECKSLVEENKKKEKEEKEKKEKEKEEKKYNKALEVADRLEPAAALVTDWMASGSSGLHRLGPSGPVVNIHPSAAHSMDAGQMACWTAVLTGVMAASAVHDKEEKKKKKKEDKKEAKSSTD